MHDDFDIADLSSIRKTHVINEPCLWPSSLRVLRIAVVRASDPGVRKVTESQFLSGTQSFCLSHARDMLIISFLISSPSLKFTSFPSFFEDDIPLK